MVVSLLILWCCSWKNYSNYF